MKVLNTILFILSQIAAIYLANIIILSNITTILIFMLPILFASWLFVSCAYIRLMFNLIKPQIINGHYNYLDENFNIIKKEIMARK